MAGRTLVKDLLWRVSVLLQDDKYQFTRWSEEELVDWLNDGVLAICTFHPMATTRTVAMKLQSGTKQSISAVPAANVKYSDGTSPATTQYGVSLARLVRNMGADGMTPGAAINISDSNDLDATDPLWHSKTGTSIDNYVFSVQSPKEFWVTPGAPAGTDVWVDMTAAFAPDKIPYTANAFKHSGGTDTSTNVPLDDEYLEALVNYICARAHMKDSKFAVKANAQMFEQMFVGWLNAKVQTVTGVNPNLSRLPLAPQPVAQAQ